jgi:ABC-type antimicrobial peptide transport system ATPase subunit
VIGNYGGETGSTRVVKTHLLPGMIPPLSGQITSANDNEALAVAA